MVTYNVELAGPARLNECGSQAGHSKASRLAGKCMAISAKTCHLVALDTWSTTSYDTGKTITDAKYVYKLTQVDHLRFTDSKYIVITVSYHP